MKLLVTLLLAFAISACSDTDTMESDDAGDSDAATSDAGNNGQSESDANNQPDLCGNGTVDPGELCEPFMLEGETCATLGFSSGTLSCNSTCDGYDTSACSSCNNGTLDEGEECDGLNFNGATCENSGFDTGTIRCIGCQLDTTECEITTCGNGTFDQGEQCDGTNFAGATCQDEGFDGGTLGCTDNCQLVTTGCSTCGDDTISGDEECDGASLGGQFCTDRGFSGGTLGCTASCTFDESGCSTCGDGIVSGDEDCDGTEFAGATCQDAGFDAGTIGCTASCTFETSACTSLPKPAPGEVVITEFMPDPSNVSDADGEWFEIYNTTANELSLSGCEFRDSANEYTVSPGTTIVGNSYFTVARSSMAGFVADIDDLTFGLGNGGDDIEIWCDDGTGTLQMIDVVTYDGGPNFPDPTGASIQLDSDFPADATFNDDGANYCEGRTAYGSGDLGTPGAANESCAFCGDDRISPNEVCDGTALGAATCGTEGFDTGTLGCDANCQLLDTSRCADFAPIGFCRLQAPVTINAPTNSVITVAGRVQALGITDSTTATDASPALVAELGYGPDGSDPAVGTGWTWQAAAPNAAYDDSAAGGEANVDEYQADLVVPSDTNSPYDYVYRFSGDAGATWTYCDSNEATPVLAAEAGQMVATAPIAPVLYFSQYVEGSSGNNKALEIYNGGSTAADLSLCRVNTYNGGTVPNTSASYNLAGTLAPGAVYTICHPNASYPGLQNCDLSPVNNPQFNGDDAVELRCDGMTVDVIGQIGVDPGAAWTSNGVSTEDVSLTRKCSVTQGDSDGTDAFDPSLEWNSASDVNASVGSYTCP